MTQSGEKLMLFVLYWHVVYGAKHCFTC